MVTNEELRREIAELKKNQQKMKENAALRKQKQSLMREVKDLKNPRTSAFKSNLKKGLKTGGKSTLHFLDVITRPQLVSKVTKKRRRR